jgi:sigma54-dependent transcription regulator
MACDTRRAMVEHPTVTITGHASRDAGADERELSRLVVAMQGRSPLVPALRVSLADVDDVQIGRGLKRAWRRVGRRLELELDDDEISRSHVSLRRTIEGWELSDLGSKNGTKVNAVRTARVALVDGDTIEIGPVAIMFRDDAQGCTECGDLDLAATPVPDVLRTASLDVDARIASLVKIAPARLPLLVRGEVGTGKETLARAIHEQSGRAGEFVAVHGDATEQALDELLRRAAGGTLFFDELGELRDAAQAALLRFLETDGNVRIIAATVHDLESAPANVRPDLYVRLIGYVATLPPLRTRREDIGTVIAAILRRIANQPSRVTFQQAAVRALLAYPYPHNIRELEAALREALAASDGEIVVDHLPEPMRAYRAARQDLHPDDQALRERLTALLREHRGNVTAVGRSLGKAPVQIRRWCRRFAIELATFRG